MCIIPLSSVSTVWFPFCLVFWLILKQNSLQCKAFQSFSEGGFVCDQWFKLTHTKIVSINLHFDPKISLYAFHPIQHYFIPFSPSSRSNLTHFCLHMILKFLWCITGLQDMSLNTHPHFPPTSFQNAGLEAPVVKPLNKMRKKYKSMGWDNRGKQKHSADTSSFICVWTFALFVDNFHYPGE